MKKSSTMKRFMNYRNHVIWFDPENKIYAVAIKRDGTDDYFSSFEEAMDKIDEIEERR